MKKIVTFVLAAAMAVSLAACGQAPQSSLEGYQTSAGVDMNPQSGISIDDDSKAEESKAASSKTDDEPSLSANTVIFKDTQWNSGRMYVYYWSQENDKMVAWPGSEMTRSPPLSRPSPLSRSAAPTTSSLSAWSAHRKVSRLFRKRIRMLISIWQPWMKD